MINKNDIKNCFGPNSLLDQHEKVCEKIYKHILSCLKEIHKLIGESSRHMYLSIEDYSIESNGLFNFLDCTVGYLGTCETYISNKKLNEKYGDFILNCGICYKNIEIFGQENDFVFFPIDWLLLTTKQVAAEFQVLLDKQYPVYEAARSTIIEKEKALKKARQKIIRIAKGKLSSKEIEILGL